MNDNIKKLYRLVTEALDQTIEDNPNFLKKKKITEREWRRKSRIKIKKKLTEALQEGLLNGLTREEIDEIWATIQVEDVMKS